MCVDIREPNAITLQDLYPFLSVDSLMYHLGRVSVVQKEKPIMSHMSHNSDTTRNIFAQVGQILVPIVVPLT